jgi:hypothetical protein
MYVVQHTIEGEIEAFLLSHDHESFPGFFWGGGGCQVHYMVVGTLPMYLK